ncbi:uncharacterized protein BO88DRAFT_9743 [Aspergillus vadensis CBS 113365]|uniref:Epidermal growth factor receptor-like transmembrane-juxtamembrane segment domain-containing protein n=1 Tax=Aspergillus vadensis (strain CBS 113365 / IMI 142717 / IBT 24658) TaxID=1448311 RepID=A0A319BNY9_ASPVC|nr:hypothetical protein BO88DRAFT_9743 [Aspergillus vadensis CBS 113365]PYH74395.1 hypothetical protein BO88DRAFT_9743 [Aspergillus vadensis CBS 113365]
MAGIGGGSNYNPGGESEFTTQDPWGSEHTTTATYYPGETTRTTTQQWTPITTSESSSQPTTATATATHSSSTSSSTSTSTAVKSTSSSGSSSSNNQTIAIAVPVAVVGAAIIALLLFFILRRRRQKRNRATISQTNINQPPVSMGAVPRQVRSPPQQQRPQQAANGATWEFAPTNSHDIPFTGPIPGRPVPQEPEHINPTNNHPRDFSPPSTNNHNFHTAATAAAAAAAGAGAGAAAAAAAEVPNRDNNNPERSPQPTMPAAWPSPEARLDRPISPFDHPLDDAVSEISRRSYTHARDMDDVSSVSSFEDDERRPAMRR